MEQSTRDAMGLTGHRPAPDLDMFARVLPAVDRVGDP
jgi:hypothetical protein